MTAHNDPRQPARSLTRPPARSRRALYRNAPGQTRSLTLYCHRNKTADTGSSHG